MHKKFNLLLGTHGIYSLQSSIHVLQRSHRVASFAQMAPHHRKAVQTKAEEDATREANIAAAIQVVREKREKALDGSWPLVLV